MKIWLLALLLLSCTMLKAQQVVTTAGSTLSNSGGSMSFTIGESVTSILIKGEKNITQGFQQPFLVVSSISEQKNIGFSISAYPNPTIDNLTLKIDKEDVMGMKYFIIDAGGRLLISKNLETSETIIPFEHYQKGFYVIKIQNSVKELKTFKIIKQ